MSGESALLGFQTDTTFLLCAHMAFPWCPLMERDSLPLLRCCHSLAKSCLTPKTIYSTPGFPVLHFLLEFAQTHVHWVDGAIQPSHPLLSTSPPTLNFSKHQGLFQWDSSPRVSFFSSLINLLQEYNSIIHWEQFLNLQQRLDKGCCDCAGWSGGGCYCY